MKIAIAQLNYHIGNFESNKEKMISAIANAKKQRADLVIFAELAISGYPPRDFLEFDDFIDRCWNATEQIAQACVDIAAVVGLPTRNATKPGKRLYNSAAFLYEGKIADLIHKSLLPTYDIFDEYRYFEPNRDFHCVDFKGKRLAISVCEDIWNLGVEDLYPIKPMDELIKENPDVIINIAASPFHYEQSIRRKTIMKANVDRYHLPLFYANHVGAQTELIFDGGSLAYNEKGELIGELNYFEEDLQIFDLADLPKALEEKKRTDKIALIHDALVLGVKNYFQKLGFERAVLGLSGGIDSAVTMVIAAKALGAENVHAVLLPSHYSSDHSITDAEYLAKKLGSPYEIIPIKSIFERIEKQLEPQFKGLSFGIAEENIQARIRGVLLMALSNKFGYILLNTSNKSEAAVGYGTLYGDMNGGLSVLGDVYKVDVFELARYINRQQEIIPWNTIQKAPSAELRPNQKDSDSLPDYEILDAILYQYIEKRKGPHEIVAMGYEETVVNRVLKLVNTSEYKRHQAPPILRVSTKAFGQGRRMPIVAKYLC
ncbi:MAG TPA: NAD+ synthase [Bacteroidales bacterium]|nr:NAD+ synthase [Bacteroidales bacterium]